MKRFNWLIFILLIFFNYSCLKLKEEVISTKREIISLDTNWFFALGHPYDADRDFKNGTGYFSYFAKTGYGDGAAANNFDDRAWRVLDLPHDWCVELPFASDGGHSHGYKAIGRNYPENSVGWYRKKFYIPETDLGKRISIEFDGVHRNSIVWVNGFYLGTELSGYTSFGYDITDYLNYGGENIIAVRIDATIEEGWYYEGAGIVRSVSLLKTSPLHVARWGTFVTTELKDNKAIITVRTRIINHSDKESIFNLSENIYDNNGDLVISGNKKNLLLAPYEEKEYYSLYKVKKPKLWSLEDPSLYKLHTILSINNDIADTYQTKFGIRTFQFDPDKGFFLNGQHIILKGTNNHQDHAGVGRAIPEALHEFRVKTLKIMGCNAIRTSHDPPDPAFLDVCDRMGMLVMDENRLMGTNQEHYDWLERLIKRDRNHPCVFIWSLGNEEWAIEGNITGARIAKSMQDFAQRLDSSRAFTAACSGGWDYGIGTVTQVMGYNYLVQGDIDEHHKKFPWQSSIGTEESNTIGTRGIYITDKDNGHLSLFDNLWGERRAERGWKFYSEREFLSGLFYWTGFDYRGEPNPLAWPAVSSQFGILDLCGFPKDIYYYLKSWWTNEPVLYILPHWNWSGDEGKTKKVIVFSNCNEVELFLNDVSLGKQEMLVNGHLEWDVEYQPGILLAKGYSEEKKDITFKVETTDEPSIFELIANRNTIESNNNDVVIINISLKDLKERVVPVASNDLSFTIAGPGKIIGVGNGNPSSHEKDRFFETILTSQIIELKELPVSSIINRPEVEVGWDDSGWSPAFKQKRNSWRDYFDTLIVIRGTFDLEEINNNSVVNLFTKSIVENQSIYVNGHLIEANIERDAVQSFRLDHNIIRTGKNVYAVTGQRFRLKHQWDEPNTDPGLVQVINPPDQWKRKAFNGYAQVIIQSTNESGKIKFTVNSEGIKPAEIIIQSLKK